MLFPRREMLVLVDAGELHIHRRGHRRGQFLLFDILRDLRAPGMATGREADMLKS